MARTLDIKVSGCPNGCGQHHIAAIGFQGSLRKSTAVQYRSTSFRSGWYRRRAHDLRPPGPPRCRHARAPQALERLVRLYAAEKAVDETPLAFSAASRSRA
jgi:sulfite reductase beta subunit-like hemoprotein